MGIEGDWSGLKMIWTRREFNLISLNPLGFETKTNRALGGGQKAEDSSSTFGSNLSS
jgi:hypothetical protein